MPAGRKPHEPTKATRELVQLHAMVGTDQEAIADILDVDPKTLRKHYRKELDQSKAKANATIGGALFNKAKAGDTAAMIFWMKTQARWSERHDDYSETVEVEDKNKTIRIIRAQRNSDESDD